LLQVNLDIVWSVPEHCVRRVIDDHACGAAADEVSEKNRLDGVAQHDGLGPETFHRDGEGGVGAAMDISGIWSRADMFAVDEDLSALHIGIDGNSLGTTVYDACASGEKKTGNYNYYDIRYFVFH
jgi:hypothetical protein